MNNKIIFGDALTEIKNLPDKSIDLIFTDPPYGLHKFSKGNIISPNAKAINNDISDWDQEIDIPNYVKEFKRIVKPTGNIFVFTSPHTFGSWHNQLNKLFDSVNFFTWHKTNPTPNIFKNSFLQSTELIICAWNKGHTWNYLGDAKMHNHFESPICMKPERLDHPTQKPISIIRHIVEIASNKDNLILDPFAGTGTTGVAGILLNRNYILIENNKKYFEILKNRIEKARKRLGLI